MYRKKFARNAQCRHDEKSDPTRISILMTTNFLNVLNWLTWTFNCKIIESTTPENIGCHRTITMETIWRILRNIRNTTGNDELALKYHNK